MRRQFAKNVIANWSGIIATAIAQFFLTPFILHRVGDVAFGLWILIGTFTGYYGMFDFGIRNSIIRYVAQYNAKSDIDGLSKVASTTVCSYGALGTALALLVAVVALLLDKIFKIPPEWVGVGRQLVWITGIGAALGFPFIFFGGMLEGLQRFTWVGGVQVVATIVRTFLIVVALQRGHGIVAIALITAVTNLLSSAVYAALAFQVVPDLRLRWTFVDKATFQKLGAFGIVTFWIGIAHQLRFQSDAFVIGAFLWVGAISTFAIASKLALYATDFVQAMASVLTPMFSHFDARGEYDQMRRLLLAGNQCSALLAFPIAAVFIFLGRSLILAWVGANYLASYPLGVVLVLGTAMYVGQAAAPKVLYGLGRHTSLAWALGAEGVANLVLSILLVRHFGLMGVAVGTFIPLAITCLVFLPINVSRNAGITVSKYVVESFLKPMIPCLPLAATLALLNHYFKGEGIANLVVKGAIGGVVYVVAVAVFAHWTGLFPAERYRRFWQVSRLNTAAE